MNVVGTGKRVRIYIGEHDKAPGHREPLWETILDFLRKEGAAGATMLRGLAGFGAHSKLHLARLADIAPDLPVIVEWVDGPERVERLLPHLCELVPTGTITLENVEIVKYTHRQPRPVPPARVHQVMTRQVTSVREQTPVEEVLRLLLDSDAGALPVIDGAQRVVGIITNRDVVEPTRGATAGEIMTGDVARIGPDESLDAAASRMADRHLKRLPVVDGDGRLIGILSRVDILRTMGEDYHAPLLNEALAGNVDARVVGDVMRHDIQTVLATASLGEVFDAVTSTRLNRAIVVDAERRVLGVISDADLLGKPDLKTAQEIMRTPVLSVPADTPIAEAVQRMLEARHKVLPITDAQGRLLGAVDRADLLRASGR